MNKTDLIDRIAADAGIQKIQASRAIESFMDAVAKALRSGDKITLVGFGTFSVVKRAPKKGRNPKTGESIRIKAKKVVKFRPSSELNEKL